LGKSENLICYVQDRPGHDRRYAIDNTKITSELGWKPSYTFEQGMKETIEWHVKNQEWINNIASGSYKNTTIRCIGEIGKDTNTSIPIGIGILFLSLLFDVYCCCQVALAAN